MEIITYHTNNTVRCKIKKRADNEGPQTNIFIMS